MSLLLRWVRMHALTQQQNGAVFSSLSLRVQKQKLLFIVFDVEIQDPVCQQMRSIQQNLLQNVSGIISALTSSIEGIWLVLFPEEWQWKLWSGEGCGIWMKGSACVTVDIRQKPGFPSRLITWSLNLHLSDRGQLYIFPTPLTLKTELVLVQNLSSGACLLMIHQSLYDDWVPLEVDHPSLLTVAADGCWMKREKVGLAWN